MTNSLNNNRTSTQPIAVPRTRRVHTARGLTSLPAGKMVPVVVAPLLREDNANGNLRLSFEMMETAEILMNAVHVSATAWLVPMLALDRFDGMDALNRSYEGVAVEGLPVVPYIETQAFGAHELNDVYTYLGLHGRTTQLVNTAYLESYNQIWNFRARNRSKDLPQRTRLQTDLAPAFWRHEQFKHIVPDFDQALIDGEVALNVVNAQLPVKGLGVSGLANAPSAIASVKESNGATRNYAFHRPFTDATLRMEMSTGVAATAIPMIFAEMQANGITVSLSNIELAKKTAAFAQLRAQYTGHTDAYLINLLMDGISIPEQAYNQPMLIGEKSTIFGMSKRYASDAANLTESVVNGATFLDMAIHLPRIPMGGVIMICVEVTPEQLFERQREPFLHTTTKDTLPSYLRDTLDPEKVSIVPCEHVDIDHATPTATFGYAPLGYEWNVTAPRIGGRFYRPEVDAAFDEDRQRIWAVETANPTLSDDFYICTNIHTKPFVVTDQDPFEVVTQGDFLIEGNTVFGPALVEASNDYDTVLAEAPQARIVKP